MTINNLSFNQAVVKTSAAIIIGTFIMKKFFQKLGLVAIDTVAMPLHMTMQLGSNVLQLGADGVALGEGYLTSKIDKDKDAETVANARVDYTQERFRAVADKALQLKHKMQKSIDHANAKMENIKQNISKVKEAEVEHVEDITMVQQHPVEHNLAPGANGTLVYNPGGAI